MASTGSSSKTPDPMTCALATVLLPELRARLSYAENPVSWTSPAYTRGHITVCARPVPACRVRSCGVVWRRESERRPGCREAVPGTAGGRRPLVVLLEAGRNWGVCRARGRVSGRAAQCLPAVRSRACVDAWAGAASGGSFRAVALVTVWDLGLMLHEQACYHS